MRIIVTGHTGFKGSWLCLKLKTLGHEVHGISLHPPKNGIFDYASVGELCSSDLRIDIRDKGALDREFTRIQPEVIFHLAAQALVLTSFEKKYETYSTNISGTLNVLDASLKSDCLKGIIVITTDKVYQNTGERFFSETDPLGGEDPYSSSKALADLLTTEWSSQHQSLSIGIARAGNVIGGGDVSANRLIPDIINSIKEKKVPIIRNPSHIRPWQHVIDCLSGYLNLMNYVLKGNSGAFNFGPASNELKSVEEVTKCILEGFNLASWIPSIYSDEKEQGFLALDSQKAHRTLGWKNKLTFEESMEYVVAWYQAMHKGMNMREVSMMQIESHERL